MKGRLRILAAAFLVTASASALAADIVEIRVRGHYFTEPATVEITVEVKPDAANTALRIEVDGDREYRSTEVELAGLDDKRIHTIEFRNLPAGSYALRAEVLARGKVRGMATVVLEVAGST